MNLRALARRVMQTAPAMPAPTTSGRRQAHGAQGDPATAPSTAAHETRLAAAATANFTPDVKSVGSPPPSAGGFFNPSASPRGRAPALTPSPGLPSTCRGSNEAKPLPLPEVRTGFRAQCRAVDADRGRPCGLLEGHPPPHRNARGPFYRVAEPGQSYFPALARLDAQAYVQPEETREPRLDGYRKTKSTTKEA